MLYASGGQAGGSGYLAENGVDTSGRVIEGSNVRAIYSGIVHNRWVTELSHAAYLGKELARVELALKYGFKYIQDGA
jgi:dihydropteroate synthase